MARVPMVLCKDAQMLSVGLHPWGSEIRCNCVTVVWLHAVHNHRVRGMECSRISEPA